MKEWGAGPESTPAVKVAFGAWQVKDCPKHKNPLPRPIPGPHQAPHLRHRIPPLAQPLVLLDHIDDGPGLAILTFDYSPERCLAALDGWGASNEKLEATRRRLEKG